MGRLVFFPKGLQFGATACQLNLATTNSADLTGGGDGQRLNVIADPRIDNSERGMQRMFNTSASRCLTGLTLGMPLATSCADVGTTGGLQPWHGP